MTNTIGIARYRNVIRADAASQDVWLITQTMPDRRSDPDVVSHHVFKNGIKIFDAPTFATAEAFIGDYVKREAEDIRHRR
jgi:hypothetical protein